MGLTPTLRPARAAAYRRPGGPWDVPTLDALTRVGPRARGLGVVDGEVRLDPAALDAAVDALAGSLRARGVRRRDAVTWQLANGHEAVVLYRACWRLGAVAVPIHHQVGPDEVSAMIDAVAPVVAVAPPDAALAGVTDAVIVADLPTAPPVLDAAARPADVAVVLFTSGSTGRPKGVLHTHRGLAHKMLTMVGVHGLGPGDVALMPLPMAHVSGLLNGLLVPAAAGMTTVLMPRWDADAGLALVAAERVSFMVGPPPLFTGLMEAPGFSAGAVASLRVVSTGAMGVSEDFVASAAAGLGAQVKRSYGSTEVPTITTCGAFDGVHDAQLAERGRLSDGQAVGEAEVRTVDPATGRDVGADRAGEVWCRGPEMFVGYLDAGATAEVVHRGWFRTGDLGVLDGDGWLRIVGRLKDTIIRGGENISPVEVEQVLEEHPAVRQAVVVGRPDDRLGERVVAFVVSDRDVGLEDCREWFAARGVARFKVPEDVVRLDAVPVLPAGKPDRAALRARAAADAGTAVTATGGAA